MAIDVETKETVRHFILGGSKITADGNCSHEIKRRLLIGRKVMTNLDSILKSRDITLPTSIFMYGHPLVHTVTPRDRQGRFYFPLLPWRDLHEVAKILEFQLQHQSFQRNPRADPLRNGLIGSPCRPRDSQESSPTPQFKSINSLVLSFLDSPTLTSIHDHWKNHSLD